MGYITGHGGMAFGYQQQRMSMSNNGISDIMPGEGYIYCVYRNLNNVRVYYAGQNGLFGSYWGGRNWYSDDSTIHQICRSGSSVPSAYAVYVKDGKNYLIGWSMDNTNIYEWEINGSHSISTTTRVTHTTGIRSMPSYSRAGWDGKRYVYFMTNDGNSDLYRFDIETKEVKKLYEYDDMNSINSSYTGSGMRVFGGRQPWWPDGTNESGTVGWKSYNTYGGTYWNISGFYGSIGAYYYDNDSSMHFHPYLPIAYLTYWDTSTMSVISLCYPEIKLKNINKHGTKNGWYLEGNKYRERFHEGNNEIDLTFDFEYEGDLANTYGTEHNSYKNWKYRVYLNDVLIQNYQADYQKVPFTDTVTIDATAFHDGENKLTIDAYAEKWDNSGHERFLRDFYIFFENEKLNIRADLSVDEIHNEAVLLSCEIDNEVYDKTNYQILINGEVYQDWTEDNFITYPGFYDSNDQEFGNPIKFVKRLLPESFTSGDNTITIKAREEEDYRGLPKETNELTLNLRKNNSVPTLDVEMVGRSLHISADDADKDKLRWRVLVDGNQVAPADGWSIGFEPPFSTIYRLPRDVIRFNQDQIIKVEVMDVCGDIVEWTKTVSIDYSGLIFTDRNGTYYSNDIGEVLQYLNMGIVVARTKSPIHKIYLQNNLGYTVNDIHLKPLYDDLDPDNEIIELSKNEQPFVPLQELVYDQDLAHGDKIPVFVRLNLLPEAGGGKSNFRVMATAAPL